jgi:SAM-dependent methyltransferase
MMEREMDRLDRIANGFIEAKILLAGTQLRLFDTLTGDGATAEEAARQVRGERRGVEILLDALVAMEIVEKRDQVYRLPARYVPWLTEASPTHFPALLRHRNRMFRHWAHLEETITRVEPRLDDFRGEARRPGATNEDFIRAMYAVGHDRARGVADRIDLSGVRTLADIAGGPGHYLAELARRAPDLEPYLIDLPATLEVARRLLASSPLADRVQLIAWDVYADPPPAGLPPFDLVFISQLLHGEPPERNRELLARLRPLVAPGGRVIVHENVVEAGRTAPTVAALFAVNMLAMTEGGRTYTEEEILSWGREAGFVPETGERIDERSYLVRMRRET